MPQYHSPFFSVVMPAFNAAGFIVEAIESVVAQTFSDWELIVVDDGSTDETLREAQRLALADSRIKVGEMPSAGGNAYAPRCMAVRMASGQYVAVLDADDTLAPDYLELLAERIAQTDADCVYGRVVRGNTVLPRSEFDTSVIYAGRDLLRYTLCQWTIAPNGAVKRDLYNSCIDEFDHRFVGGMNADELLGRLIMINAKRIAFAHADYYYRIHPGSITQRGGVARLDVLSTDVALCRMVDLTYEADDVEHLLCQKQLFADLTGLISWSVRHRKELAPHRRAIKLAFVSAREKLLFDKLAGHVNPLKLALLRFSTPLYQVFTEIYVRLSPQK